MQPSHEAIQTCSGNSFTCITLNVENSGGHSADLTCSCRAASSLSRKLSRYANGPRRFSDRQSLFNAEFQTQLISLPSRSRIQIAIHKIFSMQAYPPKAFPKLPATLFRDVRPRGALFVIASTCARTMVARSLKKLDFSNPALRKQV